MSKKIALVYDAIYPFNKGGGEKRFHEIGKRLISKDTQIHLYGMKSWNGPTIIKRDGMYLHGICPKVPLYNKEGKRTIKQAIIFGINSLKLIKEDFDIIDCCGFPYFSLFACKIICLLKNKKLNSTWYEVWGREYWKEYLGGMGNIAYIIEKLSVLMPDKIISISKHTTNKLKNNLLSKKDIVTIPVGIDFNYIQKIRPSSIKSDIIFVGRLLNHKNIDVLIRSIQLVREKYPVVKCLIIGDGPEKKKLETLVKKLNLKKNVKFLGFLDNHDDVYALMKSSKIFVLPSTREGFGIVVIEANACGIPVITIDHETNASKDLIKNGKNGYVCRLNEKEMAEKIADILDKGLGGQTKQICVDSARKHDWEKIVREIEEVYLK
ncbi:glycosyltransferase family 4 protein [Patescibacteria group bacterium]|nr:glycosyltransferase family 4 protein [Patescibacteria group bacterium]